MPDGSYCNLCCFLDIDDELKNGEPLKNTLYKPCENLVNGACNVYENRSDTCRAFDCQKASPSLLRTLHTIANLYCLNSDKLPALAVKQNHYFRAPQ